MKPLYNFNDMLNKPDLKIETLLDEEDFLVEFKQMNPKLLDLLISLNLPYLNIFYIQAFQTIKTI